MPMSWLLPSFKLPLRNKFLVAVIHIGCISLLFILWNPRGTSFFNPFCDAQLSRDVVLRSPHFIFGKKREKDLKSDRNNCTEHYEKTA